MGRCTQYIGLTNDAKEFVKKSHQDRKYCSYPWHIR